MQKSFYIYVTLLFSFIIFLKYFSFRKTASFDNRPLIAKVLNSLLYGVHTLPNPSFSGLSMKTNIMLNSEEIPKSAERYLQLVNTSKLCTDVVRKSPASLSLDIVERKNMLLCISNYVSDYKVGNSIWLYNRADIRWRNHTYLNSDSIVLDIGGNTGIDAKNIISLFHPQRYIILEPVSYYYDLLKKMFSKQPNVQIFQFGAGGKNVKLNVSIAGNDGDATSVFTEQTTDQRTTIQILNVTEIFKDFGIGCSNELDLLTVNCEGCEFEVLEELLQTNLIHYVKNVQFATHSKLLHLKEPQSRYCRIQELLTRTHTISYQYKFIWESWHRKINV